MKKPASFLKMPAFGEGQRIGLFGGSFDPPHEGHLHVALTAIKACNLDWLWILVAPGNPLKKPPESSARKRRQLLEPFKKHRKIILTDVQDKLCLRFSVDIIKVLKERAPLAYFVWVMGADNFASFHRWRSWDEIAGLLPIAVIDRKEGQFSALNSKAAQRFSQYRLPPEKAALLASVPPPAWIYLHGKHIRASSSSLRNARKH